ncbi:MAG: D-alanyl-D-alanine carboxypeptidase family protein [Clostridia bacterium]|nr:D-alanyl-D-alanine carboxypeptidase family protein [Clostridia bacterium]
MHRSIRPVRLAGLAVLALLCASLSLPALAEAIGSMAAAIAAPVPMPAPVPAAMSASVPTAPTIAARSAILVDAETGQVLYALNADERLAPASITKIMTILIAMEHVRAGRISLDDEVTVSTEASLMGGSQVYLKEREKVPVRDLLAAAAIRSANDASLAIAEHVAGTADDFVMLMNRRAAELGMVNTHFSNPEGLDAPDHDTTAADIAIMARELVKHPEVLEWTRTWIGKMRGGAYDLFNTNRLIVEYEGADGLKTGHTETAGYCLAGTAKRGDLRLVSVVMGTATDKDRVRETAKLLDYGFRNYERVKLASAGAEVGAVRVRSAARQNVVAVAATALLPLAPRGTASEVKIEFEPMKEGLRAPIKKGQVIGRAVARHTSGAEYGSVEALAQSHAPRANFIVRGWRAFVDLFARLFRKG